MFPASLMIALWIFLIVAAIMSIFIPFWVFRIRNEAIVTNKLLREFIESYRTETKRVNVDAELLERYGSENMEKCWSCLKMTRSDKLKCIHCGATISPGVEAEPGQ